MQLSDLQHRMQQYIFAQEENDDSLRDQVRATHRVNPDERLRIYRETYLLKMQATLWEDYPWVASLLGEDLFNDLAQQFARAHPPIDFNLTSVSDAFPDFLQRQLGDQDVRSVAAFDLARYEKAFYTLREIDGNSANKSIDPSTLTAEALLAKRLAISPTMTLFTSRYNLSHADAAANGKGEWLRFLNSSGSYHYALYRKEFIVYRLVLKPQEFTLLQKVKSGASVADTLNALLDDMHLEDVLTLVQTCFAFWSQEGLIKILD